MFDVCIAKQLELFRRNAPQRCMSDDAFEAGLVGLLQVPALSDDFRRGLELIRTLSYEAMLLVESCWPVVYHQAFVVRQTC